MKLATFEVDTPVGPARRIGTPVGDELVDLTAACEAHRAATGPPGQAETASAIVPPDMLALLERDEAGLRAARAAREYALETDERRSPSGATIQYGAEEVRLLAPLPRPTSFRDFMAFEEHVENGFEDGVPDVFYELPAYYKGSPETIVAPGETVRWPSYSSVMDYELEIAAVVGRRGRDIPAAEAWEHIAGVTILNDFSARDMQGREMASQLGPAKGKDFASGLGPYLTLTESFDIDSATMVARVNGEEWSRGSAGDMYHSFADIVEHASRSEMLVPGDVLGSGTVGTGCGLELGRWLEDGDTVALEVDGIGTLEHTVVAG